MYQWATVELSSHKRYTSHYAQVYTYMKCTAAEWAKNLRTQWFTLISPRYCFVPICEYIIFTVHAVVYPIKIYDIFITKISIYLHVIYIFCYYLVFCLKWNCLSSFNLFLDRRIFHELRKF